LDEGLGFNEIEQSYWLKAIKLDQWPLHEGPRPKSGNSRLNLHGSILERKSINSDKKGAQRRPHDLKNHDAS
jgi:hypothetical protein